MPIIVDTNCFANVFSRTTAKHSEFKPVLDWILLGKGMLVYGGTKYKTELRKANKYLTLFRYLKDAGKVFNGKDDRIDEIQEEIEKQNTDKKFNDIHLVAISIDTKCRLICSEDVSSIKYVKKEVKTSYYTSKANENLLCDKYVDDDMKPLCKIKKVTAKKFLDQMDKIK